MAYVTAKIRLYVGRETHHPYRHRYIHTRMHGEDDNETDSRFRRGKKDRHVHMIYDKCSELLFVDIHIYIYKIERSPRCRVFHQVDYCVCGDFFTFLNKLCRSVFLFRSLSQTQKIYRTRKNSKGIQWRFIIWLYRTFEKIL